MSEPIWLAANAHWSPGGPVPKAMPPPTAAAPGDDGPLQRAVIALKAGAVVAIPTDTVYGLAVDPRCRGATDALFALKRRPPTLELPVLVADISQADGLAGPDGLPPVARRLATRFWPGALTIVVGRHRDIDWDLGGDGRTIGLRCPAHPLARSLCRLVGPLATTSANRHGQPAITTATALAREFGDAVTVVDGGDCDAVTSSVVDVTGVAVRCIRDGAVPWSAIEEVASTVT
jgi:L-threonylcarbamoyladenylate synthase